MLGLDNYGSDSDTSPPATPNITAKTTNSAKPTNKVQKLSKKKITFAIPSISAPKDEDATVEQDNEDEPPSKKRKTGAGASSLLTMLPTPKSKNPTSAPQRVLGGGSGPGLNFRQSKAQTFSAPEFDTLEPESEFTSEMPDSEPELSTSSMLFRPTSVGKGRKNISIEEHNVNQAVAKPPPAKPANSAPAVDFFSLASSYASSTPTTSSSFKSTVSSAPSLPTFEPPEPTPTDPYPGYYQLPSGGWAAHDADYYNKFAKKWQSEYDAQVRALEKGGGKGFEDLEGSAVGEVDAMKEMERAKKEIQEREEKKAITMGAGGAPVAPKMTMTASKMSGIARSRHQLSTLLREAYDNREALEDQIAQGKRNRKEAGNKYGM
ncbi:mitotic checkpoint regulator, MAD2B-interacting-domain-containing protein, partial [Crepidotus variabilis]